MQTRQAFVWALYGATGGGKTSFGKDLARQWRRANKGKKVIGFDPQGDFEDAGVLDHTIDETDTNWAQVLMTKICVCCGRIKHPEKQECTKCGKDDWKYKFQGCLLILDDYRSLLTSDSTPKDVLRLFALKRKLGLDILIIMHNPKLLIVRLSYYIKKHWIFATESISDNFSDRIKKAALCQKAANLINQYVEEIGGVDCERYRAHYPNFPCVMVSDDSNELSMMYMDQTIVDKLAREGKI